jgi:hypothetical protein
MKRLKENKPLRYALGALLFILLCCNFPNSLFVTLCLKEDIFRPPHTKVLVSACKEPVARGVPGGEAVFVYERRTDKMYLMDLRTGEKRKLPDDPLLLDKGVFLSPELVWLEGSLVGPDDPNYRPHYILDLIEGKRYALLDLNLLPRLEGRRFDPKNYAYIQNSDSVYIHHSDNTLIALSSNFRESLDERVILSQYSLPSGATSEPGETLEQLLHKLGLKYEIIDLGTTRYKDIPSPTGKYVVRNDGIYLAGTNVPAITREYTGGLFMGGYFKGWYYDESAVVVQENSKYLFSTTLGPRFFLIPSPLLVLTLPSP